MTNNTSSHHHPTCSDVNQRQMLWHSSPSSSAVDGVSPSAPAAAADSVRLRNNDVSAALRPTVSRPCLPVTSGCLPGSGDAVTPAAAAGWKLNGGSTQRPPPLVAFTRPALNGRLPQTQLGYTGDRPPPPPPSTAADFNGRMTQLCHVDPAVRGPCIACEYMRFDSSLRYNPYNTTVHRYGKPSTRAPRRLCYY